MGVRFPLGVQLNYMTKIKKEKIKEKKSNKVNKKKVEEIFSDTGFTCDCSNCPRKCK
jgi:hypothetical protein